MLCPKQKSNCSRHSFKKRDESNSHKWFARKTREQIPIPAWYSAANTNTVSTHLIFFSQYQLCNNSPDILQPIPALYLLTWYSSANTSYVSTHLIFWNHSWLVISFTTSLTDSLNNVRAMIEKNTMELFKSLSIFCYMASACSPNWL